MSSIDISKIGGKMVGKTLLIALPERAWVESWGCCCKFCSDDPKKSSDQAHWDTLAIDVQTGERWLVHAPELQPGAKPKRDKER